MKHTHVMKFAHMSDGYLTSAWQLQALLWQQFQPAICTAQVQQPQLLLLPASEFPHQWSLQNLMPTYWNCHSCSSMQFNYLDIHNNRQRKKKGFILRLAPPSGPINKRPPSKCLGTPVIASTNGVAPAVAKKLTFAFATWIGLKADSNPKTWTWNVLHITCFCLAKICQTYSTMSTLRLPPDL